MRTVLSFQWGSTDRPQEDALLADEPNGIFLVADGVTRTPNAAGYPDPSPAPLAAERLLQATHKALRSAPRTPEGLREACRAGNDAVRRLNEELGLWNRCDYWENDLAGAVFAGLVLAEKQFIWGVLADCGVAQLSPNGELLWITEDRVASVQPYFPKLPEKERFIAVRQHFRNKPASGLDRTYGVFTGEEEALSYLDVGTRPFAAGDTLLVFTDGARHLVEDPEFRPLLRDGTAHDIDHFVAQPEHCGHNHDRTLIVIRTA